MKKNHQKGRRILALILVVAMVLSNLVAAPFTVLAGSAYTLSVEGG